MLRLLKQEQLPLGQKHVKQLGLSFFHGRLPKWQFPQWQLSKCSIAQAANSQRFCILRRHRCSVGGPSAAASTNLGSCRLRNCRVFFQKVFVKNTYSPKYKYRREKSLSNKSQLCWEHDRIVRLVFSIIWNLNFFCIIQYILT